MSETRYNIRLKDPDNVLSDIKFIEYNEKIVLVYKRLSFPSMFGGNPFAFALAANKFHIVNNKLDPPTAATDGRNIFWHSNRLEELSADELYYVLDHELMHIGLLHTLKERMNDKIHLLWNIAADFKVNSIQENAFFVRRKISRPQNDFEHPLWNGALGVPISLNEIKLLIAQKDIDPKKLLIKTRPADLSTLNMTTENIYDQLLKTVKENNIEVKNNMSLSDIISSKINLDIENHMPLEISKDELIDKLNHAIEFSKNLKGTIPGEISDLIGRLTNPEITWEEYCQAILKNSKIEGGRNRSWTKFKRRYIYNNIYIPANIKYIAKYVVLLDTSLSMSRDDIAYGVSQIQLLSNIADGVVIPVDSKPYWNYPTKIKSIKDLKSIQIVGRGVTVFNDFFRDYKKKIGNVDLIIAITDGEFGFIDKTLKPNCNVAWVIVNYNKSKTVPFGKIFPLYRKGI